MEKAKTAILVDTKSFAAYGIYSFIVLNSTRRMIPDVPANPHRDYQARRNRRRRRDYWHLPSAGLGHPFTTK